MTMKDAGWLLLSAVTVLSSSATTYHRSFKNGYPSGAQAVTRATPRVPGATPKVVQPVEKRADAVQLDTDFSKFRDKTWVTGRGKVTKVLGDDKDPPCHQRFFVADGNGRTILIAHNIDESPRLAELAVGDVVDFKGEFVNHKKGGLLHRTHPDKSHLKPDGWVKKVDVSK